MGQPKKSVVLVELSDLSQIPGRTNALFPLLRGLYGIFQTRDGWIGIIGVPPPVHLRALYH